MTTQQDIDKKVSAAVAKILARKVDGLEHLDGLSLDFGVTPKDIIHSRGTMKLYHYLPTSDEIYRIPVVIIAPLMNRYYILDLAPGQSFVEYLVDQGFDVYLVDWGVPRKDHKHYKFDHYVDEFLPECLQRVAEDCGEDDVSLLGYCLGGIMAATRTALNRDENGNGNIKNLVCLTTPVNADGMPLYKSWADNKTFDIDKLVDELGNIPAGMIDSMMQALRPLQRTAGRMQLLDNVSNDKFVEAHYRFERWATDQIPLAGETARQLFKDFLQDNKLVNKQFEINGVKIDLADIVVPFLHVTALHDHIVPTAASKDLINLVGSEDKLGIDLKGGHVSLVAGGNAVFRLWPQVSEWLGQRSE